jgi:hypothetical protein
LLTMQQNAQTTTSDSTSLTTLAVQAGSLVV